MKEPTMQPQGRGYSMSTPEEYGLAAQGRIDALDITIRQMMRVISQDLKGEDAYQYLAQGLRADAANYAHATDLRSKVLFIHLDDLAALFAHTP